MKITDYSKLSVEDAEFVEEYRKIFAEGQEISFSYNGIVFHVDYNAEKIWVHEDKEGGRNWYFDTPDDFFEAFLLDGNIFLNKLDELAEK